MEILDGGEAKVEIVLTTGKAMTIDESAGFLLGGYATEALFKSGPLLLAKRPERSGDQRYIKQYVRQGVQGGRAWVNGKVGGTLSQPVGDLAKGGVGPHAVSVSTLP